MTFYLFADILLNVFLAIAVDNLADAESLTAIEKEEAEAEAEADLDKSGTSGSVTKDGDERSQEDEEDNAGDDSKGGDEEDNGNEEHDDGAPEIPSRKRSKKYQTIFSPLQQTVILNLLLCRRNRNEDATTIEMEQDYDDEEDVSKDGNELFVVVLRSP